MMLPNKTNFSIPSSNHEFITIDEVNKTADVWGNEVKLEVNNIEKDITKLNFLFRYYYCYIIRIFENGNYTIKFDFSYKIYNSLVNDIFSITSKGENINVEVIQPFSYKIE